MWCCLLFEWRLLCCDIGSAGQAIDTKSWFYTAMLLLLIYRDTCYLSPDSPVNDASAAAREGRPLVLVGKQDGLLTTTAYNRKRETHNLSLKYSSFQT